MNAPANMFLVYTPAEDAYIRTVYSSPMLVLDIAAKLERSEDSIYKRGKFLGLKRPPPTSRSGKPPLMTSAILEAAAKPEGLHMSDMPQFLPNCLGSRCRFLVCEGRLFQASLGWRNTRYFLTQEQADAAKKAATGLVLARPKKTTSPKTRAGWEPDAPMVITAKTKFTYAAPPPERVYRTNTHAR